MERKKAAEERQRLEEDKAKVGTYDDLWTFIQDVVLDGR